jgi:hypothetical protein
MFIKSQACQPYLAIRKSVGRQCCLGGRLFFVFQAAALDLGYYLLLSVDSAFLFGVV